VTPPSASHALGARNCSDSDHLNVAIIVALPWVLLLLGSEWIYSGLWHDPWIYLGHMLNFSGHMTAFADNYAASRLSALLPGTLAYRVFSPVVANCFLHVGIYYGSAFSLYITARELAGSRAAVVATVFFGTSFFVLATLGSDYVDAYIITYFLLATALLVIPSPQSLVAGVQVFFAGTFAFCMFNANISAAILMPFLGLLVLLKRAGASPLRKSRLAFVALFLVGMVFAFLSLSAIGYSANGRLWLLQSQFNFLSSPLYTGNPFYKPMPEWIGHAYWLLVPALMVLLFPLTKLPRRRLKSGPAWPRHFLISLITYSYLSGLLISALVLNRVWQSPMAQYWYYVSWMLLPFSFIVLSLAVSPSLQYLRAQTWSFVLAVSVAGSVAAAVWKPSLIIPADTLIVALSTGSLLVVCFLASSSPLPRVLAVVLALCFANIAAATNFRIHFSYPEGVGIAYGAREFKGSKAAAFSCIVQTALLAKRVAPDSNAWFWFDIDEPLGPVFNAAACTHWWGIRIINTDFPWISTPHDFARNRIKSGSQIIALSQSLTGSKQLMLSQLKSAGIHVEVLESSTINAGDIRFQALALGVVSVDEPPPSVY
jgi:hypothetical protein